MMFEKLKDLREYEAKTQKETAYFLNVARSTYAGWECGKDIIPLKKLNELANFYQVTIDYIAGLTTIQEKRLKKIDIDLTIIAKNIRLIRLSYKMSQKEFAESIQSSQSSIHNYETGKTLITTMNAIELAKTYHISLEQLIK